jgi:hypothetical protein
MNCAEKTATFYTQLGDMVMRSEETIVKNTNQPNLNISADQPKQEEEKVDLTVKVGSRTEQLQTWFALLNQTTAQMPNNSLFTFDAAEKLNLLNGTASDKKHSILGNLPLQTIVGTTSAAEMLVLCDAAAQNQDIVKYFASNPEALRTTQKALKKIEAGMGMYLTFFKQNNKAEEETFSKIFYGSWFKRFNKSIAALTVLRGTQRGYNALGFTPISSYGTITGNMIEGVMNSWGKSPSEKITELGWNTPLRTAKDIVKGTIIQHYPSKYREDSENTNKDKHRYTSLGDQHHTLDNLPNDVNINPTVKNCMIYAPLVLFDAWNAYRAYNATKDIQFDNTIVENLQTRLMGVAKLTEGLAELSAIAQQSGNPELQAMIRDIENFVAHANGASDLGSLINHLLTKTFKGDPSYWSNRPRILATYTLMNENKTEFIPALHAAGMVDALQAAAQLYLDHQDSPARYSFVTFVNDSEPTIQLTNFWNPLMNAEKAVCNSVHLGKGGDRNMLLTGPNGSGKSVNMKGIALNIVLAQAFGIAAAEEAVLTPFTMIETYLNEQEDLQQGLSTFMAEAKKLDDICKRIKHLKANEKSFVLMDEMLKGTVEGAGAQKVYEAGKAIAEQSCNICIMATHFEKPMDLEEDTTGGFINYHVGLIEQDAGAFTRTFKLTRGASRWWFQDEAKRTRFITWLTGLNN